MSQVLKVTESRYEVTNAMAFGRVAVLYGGDSAEREVSLATGAAVLEALQSKGVDAHGWDPAEKSITALAEAGFDRVWIALHGPGGEDGAVQGALQWLGLPYTGSGVMASALAMDKVRSKRVFDAAGIPTPDYTIVRDRSHAELAVEEFGFPLIVKPACQGSSVGMTKVFESDDLDAAVDLALGYDDVAIIEPCIIGDELTVGVLQGEALPSIRIETPRVFYDYRAKYESDRTLYHCPGTKSTDEEALYAKIALAAFAEIGCSGWGRVDFMAGADGQPLVLEVNTVPGMTGHSLVPMAAKKAGIAFAELCWRILETSMANDVADDARDMTGRSAHGA